MLQKQRAARALQVARLEGLRSLAQALHEESSRLCFGSPPAAGHRALLCLSSAAPRRWLRAGRPAEALALASQVPAAPALRLALLRSHLSQCQHGILDEPISEPLPGT